MKTARFWYYVNGAPVKISLRPGQSLGHFTFSRDEEGYTSTATIWDHTGEGVRRDWNIEASDCDGRHGSTGSDYASYEGLAAGPEDVEGAAGVVYPKWERLRAGQRDQYAEAMGY